MGTVHGTKRKRKRKKLLDRMPVVTREQYGEMELRAKAALIQQLIPLALMQVEEELQQEVSALCGAPHERSEGRVGWRHGWNPGSVRMAGQRVGIRVPRVRGQNSEIPLQSYGEVCGRIWGDRRAADASGRVGDIVPELRAGG